MLNHKATQRNFRPYFIALGLLGLTALLGWLANWTLQTNELQMHFGSAAESSNPSTENSAAGGKLSSSVSTASDSSSSQIGSAAAGASAVAGRILLAGQPVENPASVGQDSIGEDAIGRFLTATQVEEATQPEGVTVPDSLDRYLVANQAVEMPRAVLQGSIGVDAIGRFLTATQVEEATQLEGVTVPDSLDRYLVANQAVEMPAVAEADSVVGAGSAELDAIGRYLKIREVDKR